MTEPSPPPAGHSSGPLRVLGIDPGLADLGYGIVERHPSTRKITWIEHGTVRTAAGTPVASRLQKIYLELTRIIREHAPHEVAVEELFFASNVSTAMTVAQARGVAILASAQSGVPLGEYSPPQIKQAITGSGKAAKRQVQLMVKAVLELPELPRPDHAADALAVALCHLHHSAPMARAHLQAERERSATPANANKLLLAQQRRRRKR